MWNRTWDLVAVVVLALVGLVTAYVTFGLLASTASASTQQYSVGGAIAGALITVSLLANVYLQIRKSTGELEALRQRNEELQQKLIRGAPRPPSFATHVDERQRIVLATPSIWGPRGGVIFDFELRAEEMEASDMVPSLFRVWHSPADPKVDAASYYEHRMKVARESDANISLTSEYIYLGGDQGGIKSLKIITHMYASSTKSIDNLSGKTSYEWYTISKSHYDELVENDRKDAGSAPDLHGGGPDPIAPVLSAATVPVVLTNSRVVCYNEHLGRVYEFDFADDQDEFPASSALFNKVLESVRFLT